MERQPTTFLGKTILQQQIIIIEHLQHWLSNHPHIFGPSGPDAFYHQRGTPSTHGPNLFLLSRLALRRRFRFPSLNHYPAGGEGDGLLSHTRACLPSALPPYPLPFSIWIPIRSGGVQIRHGVLLHPTNRRRRPPVVLLLHDHAAAELPPSHGSPLLPRAETLVDRAWDLAMEWYGINPLATFSFFFLFSSSPLASDACVPSVRAVWGLWRRGRCSRPIWGRRMPTITRLLNLTTVIILPRWPLSPAPPLLVSIQAPLPFLMRLDSLGAQATMRWILRPEIKTFILRLLVWLPSWALAWIASSGRRKLREKRQTWNFRNVQFAHFTMFSHFQ